MTAYVSKFHAKDSKAAFIQRNFAEEAHFFVGHKKGKTDDQQDNRISCGIRALEHHGARPIKSRQGGGGQRSDEQCTYYLWQHQPRHDSWCGEKGQDHKDAKDYNRKLQRREHSGGGTAGAAQKKGDATTPGGTMKQ
jgi:hypothetical protein